MGALPGGRGPSPRFWRIGGGAAKGRRPALDSADMATEPSPRSPRPDARPPGLWAALGPTRWRRRSQAGAAGLLVAVSALVSWGSYRLQEHFDRLLANGHSLSGWQEVLRLGAPWQTSAPVAAAAALVALGWWRMGSAPPEPAVRLGRDPERPVTAREIRQGLRTERQGVRWLFLAVSACAVVVLVRAGFYVALALAGSTLARATLPGLGWEVLAWGGAWFVFAGWTRAFLRRLEQWGVVN